MEDQLLDNPSPKSKTWYLHPDRLTLIFSGILVIVLFAGVLFIGSLAGKTSDVISASTPSPEPNSLTKIEPAKQQPANPNSQVAGAQYGPVVPTKKPTPKPTITPTPSPTPTSTPTPTPTPSPEPTTEVTPTPTPTPTPSPSPTESPTPSPTSQI